VAERPHLWPRAWQAAGSFGVVAHATIPVLAPAPAVAHQVGGTERRPMMSSCNLCEDSHLLRVVAAANSLMVIAKRSHHQVVQGGTPRARVLFPHRVPPSRSPIEVRSLNAHCRGDRI
jgi:hypothetical protein